MKKSFLIFLSILAYSCNSTSEKETIDSPKQEIKVPSIPISTPEIVKENSSKIIKEIPEAIKNETVTPPLTEETKKVTSKVLKKTKTITASKEAVKTIEKKSVDPQKKKLTEKKKTIANTVKDPIAKTEKKSTPLRPNHKIWNTLTKANVTSNGKVTYNGFKSKLSLIETYLTSLQNTPPQKDWSRNEKLAYWFNLYNASTVHLVASNYPVSSIKEINNGKPWDKKFIKSGDHIYSLNDIENVIVRPNYNEPRLHVAFNCAAISCPNLLNEAFSPTRLNSQLNSLSKKWINDPSKNKISENEIIISQIFNWYQSDFKKGIVSFINTHSTKTKVNKDIKITYLKYNWNLNE